MENETKTLTLTNVNFGYDKNLVLENVNLSIKENDFIGFIGPNGGGKTSLLKLIVGLLKPLSGEINIFNKKPKDMLSKIGYVPQISQIDRSFPISVLELILLGSISKTNLFGKYPKEIKEKAKALLEKMDLFNFRKNPIKNLSGGEFQRVLIAKALINDPSILVLDEPTAHIDIANESIIFDLITQNIGKKTIVMVSHDLEIVIKHVKNIVFVHKKVTKQIPEEVCEHFALGLYHKPYLKK